MKQRETVPISLPCLNPGCEARKGQDQLLAGDELRGGTEQKQTTEITCEESGVTPDEISGGEPYPCRMLEWFEGA